MARRSRKETLQSKIDVAEAKIAELQEKTVALLRRECPGCRVMVGGAVVTQSYADSIGADAYGRDAMAAVRYAEEVDSSRKT